MLSSSKKLILRDKADFFNQAEKKHSKYFSLFYKKAESCKGVFIIPKKSVGLASHRNKHKRRLYNIFEQIYEDVLSWHLVFVVKKDLKNLSDKEILKELKLLLKKADLLKA